MKVLAEGRVMLGDAVEGGSERPGRGGTGSFGGCA
jgi:hypothetical protein